MSPERPLTVGENTRTTLGFALAVGVPALSVLAWIVVLIFGVRTDLSEVGKATQLNAVQLAALKELVAFQLQAITDKTDGSLRDIRDQLAIFEERLRSAELRAASGQTSSESNK